jgi:nitrite reductase/ring-hydroxylating ferredoxin subunit
MMSASTMASETIIDRKVPHLGTYRRVLPVSIERLYENAIDWEHLPYIHRSSFARIECLDAGDWGFRARVWPQPYDERRAIVIELKLDRECRRWITSTLEGASRGNEVWTHAFRVGERETHINVDFFAPGIAPERAPALFARYQNVYTQLYDEDVAMMLDRQAQLDANKHRASADSSSRRVLGTLEYVRLRLPMIIEERGLRFRIVELDGKLVAHSTVCPHTLGPLATTIISNGIIECPWHGYRFDVATGKCVSGHNCRLAPAPVISIDAHSNVIVEGSTDLL